MQHVATCLVATEAVCERLNSIWYPTNISGRMGWAGSLIAALGVGGFGYPKGPKEVEC